jgi:hypothetical protein
VVFETSPDDQPAWACDAWRAAGSMFFTGFAPGKGDHAGRSEVSESTITM